MTSKKLILIDDHALMRLGIKEWLEKHSLWQVAYLLDSMNTVKSSLGEIAMLTPSEKNKIVAIVDLSFRTENKADEDGYENVGFEIIKMIKEANPNIPCIVFSSFDSAGFVERAMSSEIGASGYVSKSASEAVLLQAIESVANGGTYIQQNLMGRLLEIKNIYSAFTKKEKLVIDLIAQGLKNDEIAERMQIGQRTVENYISHLYDKTDTDNKIKLLEKLGLR